MTSLRARCGTIALWLLFATSAAMPQQQRPRITGISHMCVYSSDMDASRHFYESILGAPRRDDPENVKGARYYFSPTQFVEVLPLPAGDSINRMAHVAFNTDDAAGLRAYLQAGGVTVTDVKRADDGGQWFDTTDPEGNKVQFVQADSKLKVANTPVPISDRVIHIGYLVKNRAEEDRFYKALLGFRPYWYGAMQPDKLDWVSQQVPDGHDWLEYMMVGDGSTTPLSHVDQRELGVLNHFSLGVANMEQSVTTLIAADRLSPRHDGPQMGKDGKWQANLYDPDGTRVELMEFQPVMKPCCSEFTAASPRD
jgi:catechol 2,3-dioxygenase-like lactoylglutathione lyase family enzyme